VRENPPVATPCDSVKSVTPRKFCHGFGDVPTATLTVPTPGIRFFLNRDVRQNRPAVRQNWPRKRREGKGGSVECEHPSANHCSIGSVVNPSRKSVAEGLCVDIRVDIKGAALAVAA